MLLKISLFLNSNSLNIKFSLVIWGYIQLNTDLKWLVVPILGVTILLVALFAPYMSYKTDNGILLHRETVYYDGSWKTVDVTSTNETTLTGNFQDWDGRFNIASPILFIIGVSVVIFGGITLIFDINKKWGITFRVVTLAGTILGFVGSMLYVPFAIYVFQLTYITLHVTFAFILGPLVLFSIGSFVAFSFYSNIVKNRERRLELKSV